MKIQDKILGVYHIDIDEASYNVHETKTFQSGKKKDITIGYFTSLESALEKIIHLNLYKNEEVVSLKEYLLEYKAIKKRFKPILE